MEILFLILTIVFFILWNKEKKSSKAKADQPLKLGLLQ